jgi:hypothetical protein
MTDVAEASTGKSDEEIRRELYQETRKELIAQKSSNSEAYDKAVLTLSSAFLGISLAFLKDYATDHIIEGVVLLPLSWILLTMAIVTTVVSFQLSNRAADIQMGQAERYYILKDETAFDRTRFARYVDYVNWAAGTLFVLGVFLTVAFVSFNLVGSHSVSKISKSGPTHANDGQSISKMQQVDILQKAQTINNMLKAPPTLAPAPAPVPGTVQRGQSINNMQKVTPSPAPAAPPASTPTTTPKQ